MDILKFPLSKITFAFLLGIFFAFYLKPLPETTFVFLIILYFFVSLYFYLAKKDFQQKIYFGFITYVFCFCMGSATQIIQMNPHQKIHYIHQIKNNNDVDLIELTIIEKLKNGIYNQRYVAGIKRWNNTKSRGNIILNIRKDSLSNLINLPIGSNLLLKGTVIPHKEPNNPDQFDYGQYLKNKSIFAQIYVHPNEIRVSTVVHKDILYYAGLIRDKIIYKLNEKGFNNDALNVVNALILGQRQDLSPELLQDYQYAGAAHILAVSGLHVGCILLFTHFILRPLPNTKNWLLTKLILVLLSLWLFAIIAGLSPSIVRSATMFSFVSVGMYLKRNTNIYHTLIVSILILLLFQPSFLFDVGFQLSYAALFFIVWVQPLLSKLWLPKNKILQYFRDIVTVSFAAQIGCFPLSIYYFHQFPGLFFITNLIIIPFITILLIIGIIVMILALFNHLPLFLLKILEHSIMIMNKIIHRVASFENFIIKDIPFNLYMLISSYLFIIAVIIWFKNPNYKKLIFCCVSLILIQLTSLGTKWNTERTKEWIVFNMRKNSLIIERKGSKTTLYSNDSLTKRNQDNQVVKSYLLKNFNSIQQREPIRNVAYFDGKKILIIDNTGIYPITATADILLLIQSPQINMERVIQTVKPKLIIADASNYKRYVTIWSTTCKQNKIPFHAIAEKGFYKIYDSY